MEVASSRAERTARPRRPAGGIRRYGDVDLARGRFIKAAQRLGFSLDEIGELLRLDDGVQCRAARAITERKLGDVRARLADLRRIGAALARAVVQCGAARGAVRCPPIRSLQAQ